MVASRPIRRVYGKRINQAWLTELTNEGVVFSSPSVWVIARAPHKAQLVRGKVIVTRQRFVAFLGSYKLIDVPLTHPAYQQLQFDRSQPNWFGITVVLPNGSLKLKYHFPASLAQW